MAAPTTYLTIIKRFKYRGDTGEEWSNSYALSGTTPADSTAWRALFDALVLQEKTLYSPATSVVGGYGYDGIPAKGDHAIWSVDMTVSPNTPVPGTLAAGTNQMGGGDSACWVRWGLDRFTSTGKRVYLRKYFHDVYLKGYGFPDEILPSQVTALTAFAGKMRDGTFTGSRVVVDKDGLVPIGAAVSPYITTRTLKRRGKRPPVT